MNKIDAVYEERNKVVAALARLFPSGTAETDIPGWDEEWLGCVYIDLPTGQVSWHYHRSQAHLFDGLPEYPGKWDGHSTPEKYRRLAAISALNPAEEIERLRAELVKVEGELECERADKAAQIQQMSEEFRAVNIQRVIDQSGVDFVALAARAEAAEKRLAGAEKVIAPFRDRYREAVSNQTSRLSCAQIAMVFMTDLRAAAEWMESFGQPAPELNTESEWRWWSGDNEEFFSLGPFTTREEAIEEARQDQSGEFKDDNGIWRVGVHVVEARIDPLRLSDWLPDGEWLIENADERLADSDGLGEWDDGPIFEVTAEQQRDLEKRIKAACDEWQAAHDLTFKTRTFSHMRNLQHVVVPHPSDDKEPAR